MEKSAIEVFRRFDHFGIKVNFDKVKWITESITFLGYEIQNGTWSFEAYLRQKMQEIGFVKNIKDLERSIGILSYTRRCVYDIERILGPLRASLSFAKCNDTTEGWWLEVHEKVVRAFKQALDNVHWLTLPGVEADHFVFTLETDWANGVSGYMLFAVRGQDEKLVDLGSRVQPKGDSSYLGELDAMKWACQRTKAYRGSLPLIIRTDSHSLYDKYKSGRVYDSDVRVYRRWSWLIANEPGFQIQFIPGAENRGADLLSRPVHVNEVHVASESPNSNQEMSLGQSVNDAEVRDLELINQETDIEKRRLNILWVIDREHWKMHFGAFKVYHALKNRGIPVTWSLVKQVCAQCEVCAHFKSMPNNLFWGQPPFSLTPGHTIHADVIGPLTTGRGGFRYIHCIVDSATRMCAAYPMRTPTSSGAIRNFCAWIRKYGRFSVLFTDNASYYDSDILNRWLQEHEIEHLKIAPYMHNSNGLVERLNGTLIDRIRKVRFEHGGSWVDYIDMCVEAINAAVHSTTLCTPNDLWHGTPEMLAAAHDRSVNIRQRRNRGRRVTGAQFRVGQPILVFDNTAEQKFSARWKGPFLLTEKLSNSRWRAEQPRFRNGVQVGRKPIGIFHENQLQDFAP